jgi:hypothetical protein
LSPFSWARTESFLVRDSARLDSVKVRFDSVLHSSESSRRNGYDAVVNSYNVLEAGQKFIASLIQYNRLWQGEVAKHPDVYLGFRKSQDAAIERQRLEDLMKLDSAHNDAGLRARVDSLSQGIQAEIRKLPTPDFARVDHPSAHAWVISMPMYTDIADSAFVETFRKIIETAWHVHDGVDDFSVVLDVRRLNPVQLYTQSNVPENGAHITVADHLGRFPATGMILTTGANTLYASGPAIVLGPHAIAPSALVHEFGHMLGFKDGYFRSYEDRGADGYEIIEVILDPAEGVATPESGVVTRKHFEQIIAERQGRGTPAPRTRQNASP